MPIYSNLIDSIKESEQLLRQYQIQIPYASLRATNNVCFGIRERYVKRGPEVLDRPRPWIYRAWRVEKAKDRNRIRASVYIKDPQRQNYWHTAIAGGEGVLRSITNQMHQRGMLPRNYRLIGADVKKDAYGNVSRATWRKVQSRLNTKEVFAGKLKGRNTYGVFEIIGKGNRKRLKALFIGIKARSAKPDIFSLRKEAGNIGDEYTRLFTEYHAANMKIARQKIKNKGLRKRR